ncbi:hypothetical protein ANN_21689 [Periplaneta americana]|uniref:Uncharacterized protein n=1 Tax=Periplaneta americana TaxID=6978 RepID=A0ABQ8S6G9_PERAM|nr:hypothetical protein ANN_21689 [Periplaneta americana]
MGVMSLAGWDKQDSVIGRPVPCRGQVIKIEALMMMIDDGDGQDDNDGERMTMTLVTVKETSILTSKMINTTIMMLSTRDLRRSCRNRTPDSGGEAQNVINLVDKFRATECTERKKSVRRPTKVAEDAVEDAVERMQRGPNKSVKKLAVEIVVSYGNAYKILRNKLEVHGLSVTGSTRRIDIIAFKESTRSGFIIDSTVRFETDEGLPAEVDNEKKNIYDPTIPYYLQKYQMKELEVIGLLVGARGTATLFMKDVLKRLGIPTSIIPIVTLAALKGSIALLKNHLYSKSN